MSKKAFICSSEIPYIKTYILELRSKLPTVSEQLTRHQFLNLVSKAMGYSNWNEVVNFNRSECLFFDAFSFLQSKTTHIARALTNFYPEHSPHHELLEHRILDILHGTLPPEDTRVKKEFFNDVDLSRGSDIIELCLIPIPDCSRQKFTIILFRSYLELVTKLELMREMPTGHFSARTTLSQLSTEPLIKPEAPPTLPILKYLEILLPPHAMFLTERQVLGYQRVKGESVEQTDIANALRDAAFVHAGSLAVNVERKGDSLLVQLANMNYDNEKIAYIPDGHYLANAVGEIFFCESIFRIPQMAFSEIEIDVRIRYKFFCLSFIKSALNL